MTAGAAGATIDVRRHPGKDDRPGSRAVLDGRVLTCSGYDGSIRWRPGERLEQLFERRCDWLHRMGRRGHLAVDALEGALSYGELDAAANQLARFLVRQGVRPGDRVALLSDRSVDGYVGMLAVLKARAAYVPLDPAFPPDRLSYIAADAGVRAVLSRSQQLQREAPYTFTVYHLLRRLALSGMARRSAS